MKRSYILGGLLIAITLALALLSVAYLPNSYGYTTTSNNWNGLKNFTNEMAAHPVNNLNSLGSLKPNDSALFIIQPVESFSKGESNFLSSFIYNGGLVVVAANNGSSSQLLSSLGSGVEFSNFYVSDPVFNYGEINDPILPNAFGASVALNRSLVVDSPLELNISSTSGVSVLSSSSAFSYTVNSSRIITGSYALIASEHIGNGSIVVIGTPGPLLNAYFDVYGNHAFFSSLVGSRQVYIDTSHWRIPLLTIWQNELATLFGRSILNILEYFLIASFVAVSALSVVVIRVGRKNTT